MSLNDSPRDGAWSGQHARKPQGKTLFGYTPEYVERGSAEEGRHINRLRDAITKGQYDFMTYARDMGATKDERDARKEMDESNQLYCRYMMDVCLDPLTHGIDKDSILETVGLYVGMSLFSKDFKQNVNKDVKAAMLPRMEKKVMRRAKVKDFATQHMQSAAEAVENITGKKFSVFDKLLSPDQETETEKAQEKIQELRDRVAACEKDGRIPFTPESAATQYLNFGVSAYNAMRQPGADQEAIRENYEESVRVLKEMAKEDGIDEARLMRNVMAVYGKVADRYPEISRCFEETAYSDASRGEPEEEVGADGVKRKVWRGQFTADNWSGELTPREILNPTEHRERLTDVMDKRFGKCPTIKSAMDMCRSPEMQYTYCFWDSMVMEDLANCDDGTWDKEADPVHGDEDCMRIFKDVISDCGRRHYAECRSAGKTPPDEKDYEPKHHDASDIPDCGISYDDDGPQYG